MTILGIEGGSQVELFAIKINSISELAVKTRAEADQAKAEGRFEDALTLREKTLAYMLQVYGADSLAVSSDMMAYAYACERVPTKTDGVLPEINKILEFRRRYEKELAEGYEYEARCGVAADSDKLEKLNEANTAVALACCSLSFGRMLQGNKDYILELARESFKRRLDQYGADHDEAARGMEIVGCAHHSLGNLKEGLTSLYRAFEIKAGVLLDGEAVLPKGIEKFAGRFASNLVQKFNKEQVKALVTELDSSFDCDKLESIFSGTASIDPAAVLKFLASNNLIETLLEKSADREMQIAQGGFAARVNAETRSNEMSR